MVSSKQIAAAFLCVALLGCKPPTGVESDATDVSSRLVGLEYAVIPFSDNVGDGVACKFVSSDDVRKDGVDQKGWTHGLLLCDGRVPFLFLAQDLGMTQFAISGSEPPQQYQRRKIRAVQKLPELANFSPDSGAVDLPEYVGPIAGQCDLDGRAMDSFAALVRWNGESIVQGSPGISAAWGFDVESVRVIPLDPQRLTCEPMLME